jgi:hypothetical protein
MERSGTGVITASACSETVGISCAGGVCGCCDELASPVGVAGACDIAASLSEAVACCQSDLHGAPFPLCQGAMGVSRLPVPFPVVLDCIVCNLRVSTRCRKKLGLFLRLKRGCGMVCTRNTTNMRAGTNYNKTQTTRK